MSSACDTACLEGAVIGSVLGAMLVIAAACVRWHRFINTAKTPPGTEGVRVRLRESSSIADIIDADGTVTL